MRSREDGADEACLPDETLEECALGSLAAAQEALVADHAQACASCATRLERMRVESSRLAAALRAVVLAPEDPCPGEEALALYIDGALEEPARGTLDTHLSCCRRCQAALVALYRELRIVADPRASLDLPRLAGVGDPVPLADRQQARERAGEAQTAPGSQEAAKAPPASAGEAVEPRKPRYLSG